MRLGLRRTLLGTVVALCALLILGACSETTPSGTGSIDRYVAHYTLKSDGSMRVDLDFDYRLPVSGGHGPMLRIPVQVATDDPQVDRLYPLSNVTAHSPTGAPASVRTTNKKGVTSVYIGDSKTEVTGKQTYAVSYTQRGVINHVGDHEEFYWNVLDGWDFGITNISAVVSAPAPASEVSCYGGEKGDKSECTESNASITDGKQPFFDDQGWKTAQPGDAGFFELITPSNEYFTIEASYPAGTFPKSPVLTADPQVRTQYVFEWVPPTISIIVGVAAFVMTIVAIRATRPLRRDANMELGEFGMGIQDSPDRQTTPPEGLHAGEVSVLTSGQFKKSDISVMLMDLAARGALEISGPGSGISDAIGVSADLRRAEPNWRFTKTGSEVPLTMAEQALLDGIFDRSDSVSLDGISVWLPKLASKVGAQMLRDVSARGWFKVSLGWSRWAPRVFVVCLLAFMVAMIGGGWAEQQGWLGPWFVGAGGIVLSLLMTSFTLTRPIGRTREGMAIYEQAEGFKEYLRRVGEGQDRPPRDPESLAAWASTFGLADAFIEVTEPASNMERRASHYPWWLFATTGASQVQTAVNPPSSSSDSSSGASSSSGSSGGGHAGGGGGGTGGGGW